MMTIISNIRALHLTSLQLRKRIAVLPSIASLALLFAGLPAATAWGAAKPIINQQPLSLTNYDGSTAQFSVTVTGGSTYAWFLNGARLTDGGQVAGSTTTDLTISAVQLTNGGYYSLVASNASGAVTSSPALLSAHHYEYVSDSLNWNTAATAAMARSYQGFPGHLATISSAEENAVIASLGQSAWVGGFQPSGSPEPGGNWTWITGEPWSYSGWTSGEPDNNGDENALQFVSGGGWNDWNSGNSQGYIVEYESPAIPLQIVVADTTVSSPATNLVVYGANVTLAASVSNLTVYGGTITGLQYASGVVNISGASITGSNSLSATLNIFGNITIYGALTNSGIVNWLAGYITVSGGSIWNQGQWNILCDQTIQYATDGSETFYSSGALSKTNSVGTTSFNIAFTNTGAIEVQSGVINLNQGGSLGGSLVAGTNSALNLVAGNFTGEGSLAASGAGLVQLNGGALTLVSNVPSTLKLNSGTVRLASTFQGGTIKNLQLTGAALLATNTVSGVLSVSNSTISGNITVLYGGVINAKNSTFSGTFIANDYSVINWVSGQLATGASLTVHEYAVLYLDGGVEFYGVLDNFGAVDWQGGSLYIRADGSGNAGFIHNELSGLWKITCDQYLNSYVDDTLSFFRNEGVIVKTESAGTSYIQAGLDNAGLVEVESGSLVFNGGAIIPGGEFVADAGTSISFSGGSMTLSGLESFTGAGAFATTGGTVTLTGNAPNLWATGGTVILAPTFQGGAITNLTLVNGELRGTNTVTGVLNLTNSSITGSLTVAGGGVLNWHGGALNQSSSLAVVTNGVLNFIEGSIYLYSAITNQGTVVWSGSYLQVCNNSNSGGSYTGEIWNQGLWDIQSDQTLNWWSGYENFHNSGVLRKSAGTGTSYISPYLDNTGVVDAQSGTIYFNNGVTNGNVYSLFQAETNAAISIGGNLTLTNALNFQGAGQVATVGSVTVNYSLINLSIYNGTWTLAAPLTNLTIYGGTVNIGASVSNLDVYGGTVSGLDYVSGTINFQNGTVSGQNTIYTTLNISNSTLGYWGDIDSDSLTVASNATMNLLGDVYILGPLTNQGFVNISGDSVRVCYYWDPGYANGEIWNESGATWDIQGDYNVDWNWGYENFHNAGTLRKSAGTGTAIVSPYLDNTGLIDVQSGTLQFAESSAVGGAIRTKTNAAVDFNYIGSTFNNPVVEGSGVAYVNASGYSVDISTIAPNIVLHNATIYGVLTNATCVSSVSVSGPLTIATNGVLNIQGDFSLYRPLTNYGTVNWNSDSEIRVYFTSWDGNYQGEIWNQAGALWDIQCDQPLTWNWGANGNFHNAGTLRKSAGTGTTVFDLFFDNTGLIDIRSGVLQFVDTSTIGGSVATSDSGSIYFSNGSFNVGGGFTFSGPGSLIINGGTVDLNAVSVVATNLTISNANISGVVSGTLNCFDCSVRGNLTIAPNGTFNINGRLDVYRSLTNFGTVHWKSESELSVYYYPGDLADYSGEIWNRAGALWDIQCDQILAWNWTYETFHNAGTLRKSAGEGTNDIYLNLDNTGLVDVQTGNLHFYGGFTNTGTLRAASGTSVVVDTGSGTLGALEGDGQFVFNSDNLIFDNAAKSCVISNGSWTLATVITNLSVYGGTISGLDWVAGTANIQNATISGTNRVSGALIVSNVTLDSHSSLTIATNAVLNISGYLSLRSPLINQSVVNWANGDIYLYYDSGETNYYSGEIWNQAGAVWNILCDQHIGWNWGEETFHNAGTVLKTGSWGTTTIDPTFDNSGLLAVQTGLLNLNGTSFNTNSVLNVAISGPDDGGWINFRQSPAFAGALAANFTDGYAPAAGDAFAVLTYGSATGMFDTTDLPASAVWQTNYGASAFTLSVLSSLRVATITNQVAWAGLPFSLAVSASDSSSTSSALTYALKTAPSGMTINPTTSLISWTPTVAQTGLATNVTVTVADNSIPAQTNIFSFSVIVIAQHYNAAPVFPTVGTVSVDELTPLTVTFTATEANSYAVFGGYKLLSAPAGAQISTNGIITWTPTQLQSHSDYVFTVTVTNHDPYLPTNASLTATGSFTVTVREVNVAPVQGIVADATLNELTALTVTNAATDSNIYSTIAYSLLNAPSGAAINAAGVIAWTPSEAQGPGVYTIYTVATANNAFDLLHPALRVTNSFVVTVKEVNSAPVLPTLANVTLAELTLLKVTNTAVDSDIPANPLAYVLTQAPDGAAIDPATGIISWTPSQLQSPSTNVFTTVVTDTNAYDSLAPVLKATNTFTVFVREANQQSVFAAVPDQTVNELTQLKVTNAVTEPNIHSATTGFSILNPLSGMSIDANGVFLWTPAQAQSPSTNIVKIVASNTNAFDLTNPVLKATNSFTVFVKEVNAAPVLQAIADQSVNELTQLKVTNAATVANIHSTLSYSLLYPPSGMSIDSGGVITWTPSQTQSPSTNLVAVIAASSNAYDLVNPVLKATNSFAVIVKEVNTAPAFQTVAQQTVNELTQLAVANVLTFTNIHSAYTYALLNPLSGMAVDANGVFTWTPSQTQSPSTNTVQVVATSSNAYDPTNTTLKATNSFTVIVKEVNAAPALQTIADQTVNELTLLKVTNTATVANVHSTLTYALVSPLTGMNIDANGVFTWTPSQAQSPSTNTVTTIVTSSNAFDLVNTTLKATNSFTVIVKEVNAVPALPTIAQQTVNELTLLKVTNTATVANTRSTLTYALASPLAGMAIDASGVFTWTPIQQQSPSTNIVVVIAASSNAFDLVNPSLKATNFFTVVVKEVNTAPVLPVIAQQTVNELTLLTVTNTATVANIHSTLSYVLYSPTPSASIDANGVITWTPEQVFSHRTNTFIVVATSSNAYDPTNTTLKATNSFTVVVKEVNTAPVLPAIPLQTVNALAKLTVTNTATVANIYSTLTYALANPLPGMSIDASGVFTWTPTQAQSPGTNIATVIVTSSNAFDLVNTTLKTTNSFTIIVREVNTAPTLPVIALQTVRALSKLTVTNTASLSNTHATLYYLLDTAPDGVSIDSSGVITWTPSLSQAPSTNIITTWALAYDPLADQPYAGAHNTFTVIVQSLPSPDASITLSNGAPVITWISVQGINYQLQYKTTLDDATWKDLGSPVLATNASTSATGIASPTNSIRFFRVGIKD